MKEFDFCLDHATASSDTVVVAIDSGIASEQDLYERFRAGIGLPDYFGENWDAFKDCLCDLHWVNAQKVVVRHTELPRLSDEDLGIYLKILRTAVEVRSRKGKGYHHLAVVFPKQLELAVQRILRESQ